MSTRLSTQGLTDTYTRYILLGMALKRTLVHLDDRDLARLARLAEKMSRETGLRVTTAGLVRKAIKDLLRRQPRRR